MWLLKFWFGLIFYDIIFYKLNFVFVLMRFIFHFSNFYISSVEHSDISSGFPARVLGFSLYVSNSPNRSEGDLCFEDTFYTKETVPMIFSIPCLKHGHYIIFYNERLNGVSYQDEYSDDAFSDLCEVEVYGLFSCFSIFDVVITAYHISTLLISHSSKLQMMRVNKSVWQPKLKFGYKDKLLLYII